MPKTKAGYLYEKATCNRTWVSPNYVWAGSEEITRGEVNSVSQFDKESNMVPASWLFRGRAQKRNNGLC